MAPCHVSPIGSYVQMIEGEVMTSTVGQVDLVSMLNRILVHGMKPNGWELCQVGLDVNYLENIVDKVKGQIWQLPAFRPLKETAHSGRSETFQRRFAEASFADVPCLRITRKSYDRFSSISDRPYYYPLLGLNPVGDESMRAREDIELFITGNAQWILYRGSDLSDEDSFTVCESVEELRSYLVGLCGDTHKLNPSIEGVLVEIANWLINVIKEEVARLQGRLNYTEVTLTECEALRNRMNFK